MIHCVFESVDVPSLSYSSSVSLEPKHDSSISSCMMSSTDVGCFVAFSFLLLSSLLSFFRLCVCFVC